MHCCHARLSDQMSEEESASVSSLPVIFADRWHGEEGYPAGRTIWIGHQHSVCRPTSYQVTIATKDFCLPIGCRSLSQNGSRETIKRLRGYDVICFALRDPHKVSSNWWHQTLPNSNHQGQALIRTFKAIIMAFKALIRALKDPIKA